MPKLPKDLQPVTPNKLRTKSLTNGRLKWCWMKFQHDYAELTHIENQRHTREMYRLIALYEPAIKRVIAEMKRRNLS